MTRSRMTSIAIRSAVVGTLLAASAAAGVAQKTPPRTGPPVTTQGTIKSSPKADKGQAVAAAKRAEARDAKAVREEEKAEDARENAAWKTARNDPKRLLRGITLSPTERTSLNAIRNRYAAERKDLRKREDAVGRTVHAERSVVSKIEELRLRERAELRANLSVPQQAQFDRNVASLGTRKS